jgi:hypothetical protein
VKWNENGPVRTDGFKVEGLEEGNGAEQEKEKELNLKKSKNIEWSLSISKSTHGSRK